MITIVDYGLSNLLSVRRAIERCGATAQVTNDYHDVLQATKIILPGVGAFHNGMNSLKKLKLDKALQDVSHNGVPILGICLGMQMLMEESEENGRCTGLGLIKGCVKRILPYTSDEHFLRIPHIGWSTLKIENNVPEESIIDKSIDNRDVYFVHSYAVKPKYRENVVATVQYGTYEICAIIRKDNIWGCQFHPEKSGEIGLKILKNYIAMRE